MLFINLVVIHNKFSKNKVAKGSNSIKVVLPAVLQTSEYIQNKYSQSIYGKNSTNRSLNFDDGWVWI